MEQPPLIDVEPEQEKQSRLAGCGGCLGKLIPLTAGFLLLLLLAMGAALFIWGNDIKKPEDEVSGGNTESVSGEKKEKKGLAGVMDKVKRAVKGEPAKKEVAATEEEQAGGAGGSGPGNAVEKSTALAESIGTEDKSPEERNRMLKEKFGHLEEDRPASEGGEGAEGGPEAGAGLAPGTTRRGGSFGSATGTAEEGGAGRYKIWRSNFATSGSDLEFEIIFQESGGQLHFRCFILPFDAQTSRLFQNDKGDLKLSFANEAGVQILPLEDRYVLPLTKMTAFEAKGRVAGWVARGMIPLEDQALADVQSVRVGWDFDEELGDWLKELSKARSE